jgi:glyoxylase I family protein
MLTPQDQELLIRLETDIIVAQKNGDLPFVQNLLWEDFQEIDSRGGISSKAEVLQAIRSARLYDYSLGEFAVRAVDDACAVVTYVATTRRLLLEGSERDSRARRSSIWVKRNGLWKIIFHQGTPLVSA